VSARNIQSPLACSLKVQPVTDNKVRKPPFLFGILRALFDIRADGDDGNAASLKLGNLLAQILQISTTDRAMQTAIERDQRKVLRRLIGQGPNWTANSLYRKCWDALSGEQWRESGHSHLYVLHVESD